MALFSLNVESEYLNINNTINVVMPDHMRGTPTKEFYLSGKKYPVLWLLHGTYGDASDWIRRTNIEMYAVERGIIVVMPSAMNSNYSNWEHAMMPYNMWDYFLEELMPMIYGWFPASDKREDNFVAGLSMGASGALKFALNHPEMFGGAAMLSNAPRDLDLMTHGNPDRMLDLDQPRLADTIANAGGFDAYRASGENCWRLLEEYLKKDPEVLPKMYFAMGEKDFIYGVFCHFREHFEEKLGDRAEFFTAPGYFHEWRFWDLGIQKAMDYFGLKRWYDR